MRSSGFTINKRRPRDQTGIEAFPLLMLQMNQGQGREQRARGSEFLITYKVESWTAVAGPFCLLGFYVIDPEKKKKSFLNALIHILYQTFLFIISIFVWVSLRGRAETETG